MRIFHNRPLALACVLFALTSVVFADLPVMGKLILAALVGIVGLGLLFLRRKKAFVALLCLFFVLSSLLSSTFFFGTYYQKAQSLVGSPAKIEGFVLERDYSTPYSGSFRVRVTSVNGEKIAFDARLETTYSSALQVGDGFALTVTPRDFDRDGDYDEEIYHLSQGEMVVLVSEERGGEILAGEYQSDPRVALSKLKTRLSYRLYTAIRGRAGALSSALLLGDRSFLSGEDSLQFKRSGTSHLLALSGLHVSILIGLFEFFMRKLRIPKMARSWVIPFLAVGYLLITGFALSTLRAVIMACFLYFAFVGGDRYDSFTALCVALALILFVTPYAVWDLSLWMSFFAAASIVIFSSPFYRLLEEKLQVLPPKLSRGLQSFLTALFVGVVANVGLLLLIALVFGETSVLSVPVTLLLSPILTLLLPIGALTLMIPAAAPLCRWIADLIFFIVDTGADLHGVLLPVHQPVTLILLSLMTLGLILYAVTRIKARYAIPVIALFLLLGIGSACLAPILREREGISIHVMQTHGGELMLFSHGSRTVAVDLSSGVETCAGQFKEAAYDAGCNEIDDLILSRYYNRSPYLLASLSARLRVRRVRLPEPQNRLEEDIAHRLEQEAALHGIEVLYHTDDLAIEDLEVLCAEHTPFEKDEASLILLSFAVGDRVLTCLNAATLEDRLLGEAARAYVVSSHALLVTNRAKGSGTIPYGEDLKYLFLGNQGLEDRFWHLPERTKVEIITDVHQFFLK